MGGSIEIVVSLAGGNSAVYDIIQETGGHILNPALMLGNVQILSLSRTAPIIQRSQNGQSIKTRCNKVRVKADFAGSPIWLQICCTSGRLLIAVSDPPARTWNP